MKLPSPPGTNHFGHFVLVRELLQSLQQPPSRIAVVGAKKMDFGAFDLNNLNYTGDRKYSRMGGYAQSKLANYLFAKELSSRS